jgi:hypothetical protein
VDAEPGRLRIAFTTGDRNGVAAERVCVEVLDASARLCADLGHDAEEAALELDSPTPSGPFSPWSPSA